MMKVNGADCVRDSDCYCGDCWSRAPNGPKCRTASTHAHLPNCGQPAQTTTTTPTPAPGTSNEAFERWMRENGAMAAVLGGGLLLVVLLTGRR